VTTELNIVGWKGVTELPTTKHDMLFDFGLKARWENSVITLKLELGSGFRYSRDEAINLSQSVVSQSGLRKRSWIRTRYAL
jgi:hypothetical protein